MPPFHAYQSEYSDANVVGSRMSIPDVFTLPKALFFDADQRSTVLTRASESQ